MIKIHEIREMIKLIDQSSITHFELENEGDKIIIRKEGIQSQPIVLKENKELRQVIAHEPVMESTPAPIASAPVIEQTVKEPVKKDQGIDDPTLHKIVSPMVGTFYQAPAPDAEPYVRVGDHVEKNTVVCIVEAMKLMNEIEAEVRGTIVKVLVENGQLVEYGQPLFLVKPE